MLAQAKYYKCKLCGKSIEYIYPIKVEYNKRGEIMIIPFQKEHYKAAARYFHEFTHKGALDQY